MQEDYSTWKKIKVIAHRGLLTSITLRNKDKHLVAEKKTRITEDNSDYAFFEVEIMRTIDSPHVVSYLGHKYYRKDQSLILYMPYYANGDLEDYLVKHRELEFQGKMRMFIDILVGIKALHERLLIHRDLKLNNIFVDGRGRCIVGDLGITAVMEGSADSVVGTVPHQAP
jgi:serine/threonine protein kinase